MPGYGQFCPVAKASEVLAERWTPLVVRELLSGSHRFNELQRGVPLMSRSLLSKRLKELERAGVVERRKLAGQGTHEYYLTPAGEELRPIIEGLGVWGQRWVRQAVEPEDLDPALLMWDIRRRVLCDEIEGRRVVTRFDFLGVPAAKRRWWLVVSGDGCDLCLTDPGFEVQLFLEVGIQPLTHYWLGRIEWRQLVATDGFALEGPTWARRSLPKWLGRSSTAPYARHD